MLHTVDLVTFDRGKKKASGNRKDGISRKEGGRISRKEE